MYCTSSWVTLCTLSWEAYRNLNLVIGLEAKRNGGGGFLRRIRSILQDSYLKGVHYSLLGQSRVNFLRHGWSSCFYWKEKCHQNLRIRCAQIQQDLPISPHFNFQDSIPSRTMPSLQQKMDTLWGWKFNLHCNSICCRMRFWVSFSAISTWLQVIRVSFRTDTETFSYLCSAWAGNLNSSAHPLISSLCPTQLWATSQSHTHFYKNILRYQIYGSSEACLLEVIN